MRTQPLPRKRIIFWYISSKLSDSLYTFCPARGSDQVTKRISAQCRGLIVHRVAVKSDDDVSTSIYSRMAVILVVNNRRLLVGHFSRAPFPRRSDLVAESRAIFIPNMHQLRPPLGATPSEFRYDVYCLVPRKLERYTGYPTVKGI